MCTRLQRAALAVMTALVAEGLPPSASAEEDSIRPPDAVLSEDREDPHPGAFREWGPRKALEDRGIKFHIVYTEDITRNLRGGLSTSKTALRGLLDLGVEADTRELFRLDGGKFFADFQRAEGPNASDSLVGDLQGIDGLDGVPRAPRQDRHQISQIWFEQQAFQGVVRIKGGKVDANTEFDHSDTAQEFLHQSTGSSATLITLPTYPDPATGLNLFVKPTRDSQIGAAVYDGALANGSRTGERGITNIFRGAEDRFYIGELDQAWNTSEGLLKGSAEFGGWYSSNQFERLDKTKDSGTAGAYALLEQRLWQVRTEPPDEDRNVTAFFMYGWASPTVSLYNQNFGGGISWTGPFAERPHDILGLGLQSVNFSGGYEPLHPLETAVEAFYRADLTEWFSVKPDFQYVVHPGGKDTPDAFAATIRLELHL